MECDHHEDHQGAAAVLSARGVSVRFPDATEPAIQELDCDLAPGTHSALVGPNGSGKSTFLKTAAGLLRPFAGEIIVFDCPAHHCHPSSCYLPQRSDIDWNFPISVRHMIRTGSYVHLGWFRRPGVRETRRVDAAMEQLQLAALGDRQIAQLSGGQQQRVLLARALVHDAQLYLLDEPFTGLDQETMDILSRAIARMKAEGRTLLTSIHAWEQLPLHFDQTIHLQAGRRVYPNGPGDANTPC
jgi:manganese/zinc/iron transport system ATP- binding protein